MENKAANSHEKERTRRLTVRLPESLLGRISETSAHLKRQGIGKADKSEVVRAVVREGIDRAEDYFRRDYLTRGGSD